MNSAEIVFDQSHYERLNLARGTVLRSLLGQVRPALALESALDAGCGTGHFAAELRSLGVPVVAFDGRPENVEEARRRHPGIDFYVADVESLTANEGRQFDLVLCLGLLYHLENPFLAIRNLHAVTTKLLVIEGICAPGEHVMMALRDENHGRDQGLNYIAFYPSESCLVKMLYRSGFHAVYSLTPQPDHTEYRHAALRKRGRTMLVAAKQPLSASCLKFLAEPVTQKDPWQTTWARLSWPARRLWLFLGKPWPQKVAAVRRQWGSKRVSA